MSEIIINKNEVEFLERELRLKLIEENVYRDESEIMWNSNPDNYNGLIEVIYRKDESKKKLGSTFLRDLFYKKEEYRNVRERNVSIIYNYLFNKTRKEYLEDFNLSFDSKKYFLYSINPISEEIKKIILNENKIDIDFCLFEDEPDSVISSQFKDSSTGVCFYVDDFFLKNYRTVKFLLELFTESFISLVANYNVKFVFHERVLLENEEGFSLFDHVGRVNIYNFWKEESKNYKSHDSWFYKKFEKEIPFLTILEHIKHFSEETDIQKKLSVDRFLPLLKELNCLEVRELRNIYEETEEKENGRNYDILCVIGYNSYYNIKEKQELLKYFYFFQEALSNANKIRIFTIPAKRIKGKGWSSQLKPEINQLLYQYIYMNVFKSDVETYVLLFDEEEIGNASNIMWHQDYVVRIFNNRGSLEEIEYGNLSKTLLKEHKLRRTGVEEDSLTSLYFAYPESVNEVNQMISLKGGKENLSNKIYIRKMVEDFMNRITLIFNEEKYAHIELIQNNNKENLKHILNLNVLATDLFKKLESEIELFYDND